MRYYVGNLFYGDDFWHYGVKGQKKGVRRYQNPDGSLKPEGYRHYGRNPHPRSLGTKVKKLASSAKKGISNVVRRTTNNHRSVKKMSDEEIKKRIDRLKLENEYLRTKKDQKSLRERKKKEMSSGKKHVLSLIEDFAATVTKTVLTNKANDMIKDKDRQQNARDKEEQRENEAREKERDRAIKREELRIQREELRLKYGEAELEKEREKERRREASRRNGEIAQSLARSARRQSSGRRR